MGSCKPGNGWRPQSNALSRSTFRRRFSAGSYLTLELRIWKQIEKALDRRNYQPAMFAQIVLRPLDYPTYQVTQMNSAPISKLKILAYLVPVGLISPSLIWIALDHSVWMWDQAAYGKGSVELFYKLIHSPKGWIQLMLDVLHAQAPGVSWFGQFFVPLGYPLGSIDVSLLLSIWITQALTLMLMYRSISQLSGQDQLLSITGCLVVASAPLFVGMSHQYFAEPLQLLAVAWFVTIMSFAPKWNRAFILSQLLVATPVAMLAKVSSPLYCVGPGLVGLWYVFRPEPSSFIKREWLQKRVIVTLAAGILLSLAAIGWYYRNITYVVQHVSDASSGPIAEIYGKKDALLHTMIYWLGAVQNSFFLPSVLLISGLIFGLGVISYLVNSRTQIKHFTISSVIATLQILIVLTTFSFNANRDTRFLLPLLPYFTLLVCWSVAQINRPMLAGLTILIFLVQLASTHGQALGIIARIPTTSGWLVPRNSDQKEATILNSIVSRTCTNIGSQPYWNIIGIEKPWLNQNSAGYFAAKSLAPHSRVGCQYGSVHNFFEFDPDKVWSNILSVQFHYYVTIDPDLDPVPSDAGSQAVNRNYLPMLKKVQSSGLFELEPPLAEEPGILIFRWKDGEKAVKRFDYAQASAVAEHGVQAVRGAQFGENFELLGASLTPVVGGGIELKLAWRCIDEARLEYAVAVHLVDEAGKILARADFVQDVKQARIMPGAVWVDHVSVPAEKLSGARQVAIALYRAGGGTELVDRGPRDWDGHRLLLPLNKARTTETATR